MTNPILDSSMKKTYSPLEVSEDDAIESGYQSKSCTNSGKESEYASLSDSEKHQAWNRPLEEGSLPEYNGLIEVDLDQNATWYQKIFAYIGPGSLIAVGYMDPGNWSTDIAGGSVYGYKLLFVVLLSSLIGMFLQVLALRVGLGTTRDLAQACRDHYPYPVVIVLWIVSEIAICATDVAEVIGSAVALKLLFGIPLIGGVCITAADVLIVLFLNGSHFRYIELIVSILVLVITGCFAAQLVLSQPNAMDVLQGFFVPSTQIFHDRNMLFVAVGIIGATVMPHNLFLHSSIILTRKINRDEASVKKAMFYGTIDSSVSLGLALFVNAAILMVAAATFHVNGYQSVATLEDASKLLQPLLKSKAAPILFGIALLASGQNATLTGTLSGQIVMEGFTTMKLNPAFRRIATRLIAIIPSVFAVLIGGEGSANYLLILSQVVLSFALPFAMIPLVQITSNAELMGPYVNSRFTTILAILITVLTVGLNLLLMVLPAQ